MSKTSNLVVTLRKWEVRTLPVEDDNGDLIDRSIDDERLSEYTYARRDYPRGPEGKAELIADLIAAFKSEYVDFASTGNDWAAWPEPSVSNYATGEELEVTMHFGQGTPRWVIRDVMNGVG